MGPGLPRHPVSHAVKPCRHKASVPNRTSVTDQHQERRLKGVFDVPRVAEHPPAQAQHHGTVPVDQGLEGVLIPARQVTLQELPVPQTGQCPVAKQAVDLPQQDPAAGTRHRFASSHRLPDHLC